MKFTCTVHVASRRSAHGNQLSSIAPSALSGLSHMTGLCARARRRACLSHMTGLCARARHHACVAHMTDLCARARRRACLSHMTGLCARARRRACLSHMTGLCARARRRACVARVRSIDAASLHGCVPPRRYLYDNLLTSLSASTFSRNSMLTTMCANAARRRGVAAQTRAGPARSDAQLFVYVFLRAARSRSQVVVC